MPQSKHYFRTKDLVTIAFLGCLGAILSTYLGYVGSMLGTATGIPYASQLLTGIHVFWITLSILIVDKKGTALVAAILDTFVEFLMGSHLGIWVLPIGLLQGLLIELGYLALRRWSRLGGVMVGGAFAAISHIVIMQVMFHRFGPKVLFGSVAIVAFFSGMFWAGIFAFGIFRTLQRAGLAGPLPPASANDTRKLS